MIVARRLPRERSRQPPDLGRVSEHIHPIAETTVEGAPASARLARTSSPGRRRHSALWASIGCSVIVGLLIAVLATRPSAATVSATSPLLGKPAPPAVGLTVDKVPADLAALRGHWVLLNVFATWCVPCRQEHGDLIAFSEEHRDSGDVAVFGLVYADSASAVRQFRAEHGGTWPMLEDPGGRIALDFGVSGVPESFLISPAGVIAAKYVGGVRLAQLDRVIAQLKAKPQ